MPNPAPITRVIPQPRPIRLAGQRFLASEFRLADVAALQGWIETETADPFEEHAPAILNGSRDRAWKKLLWRTIDAIEEYPPRLGSPDGDSLIDSPAGMARQLVLSLRREQPAFDEATAAALLAEINSDEWSRFTRLAWGAMPRRIMERLVLGPAEAPGRPSDWSALWCSYVANAGPGAPPFESLTLTQLRTWLSNGDPAQAGTSSDGSATDNARIIQQARKIGEFWAEIMDEV